MGDLSVGFGGDSIMDLSLAQFLRNHILVNRQNTHYRVDYFGDLPPVRLLFAEH
jgi:hypothetical protein